MSDASTVTNKKNTEVKTEKENIDKQTESSDSSQTKAVQEPTVEVDSDETQTEVIDEMAALNAEQLIAKVKQAQEKADENWDLALRSKAEMDNIRRRTEKDVSNARKFGIEKLANELLPVKDSMELGIKAATDVIKEDEAAAKIHEGMVMTLKMLVTAMEKVGIKEVATEEGDAFNPEFHQAMSMQEVEGKKSNTIISVFQKGYTLNDRLLRAAMVLVAK
ncbi:MAG: nucleotide exchange factor GrpE [Pseudomonadota bacterium]